jgi:hypothetical protein
LAGWGEILEELQESAQQTGTGPDFDAVRRKYLTQLHSLTGRATIVYETDWLMGGPPGISITLEDMVAMMEVCKDMGSGPLDLIVHSPGGSAEATASIVRYLRKQFSSVRVLVPHAAMSAATMLALSADVIVMGKQSQLGPIDPQLVTAQGATIPARAILDQFERAKKECKDDPSVLGAWMPMLQQYGPALLEQCQNADSLAKRLVKEWLRTYMFRGEKYAARKALKVAKFFGDHHIHQSHSLGIDRAEAAEKGVKIEKLEATPELEDAVLAVHYATFHTLSGPAIKIVENQLGRTFVKIAQQFAVPMQGVGPGVLPQPPGSAVLQAEARAPTTG